MIFISGLHITMIAGPVAWGASWLWRHSFFVRGAALWQSFAAVVLILYAMVSPTAVHE